MVSETTDQWIESENPICQPERRKRDEIKALADLAGNAQSLVRPEDTV